MGVQIFDNIKVFQNRLPDLLAGSLSEFPADWKWNLNMPILAPLILMNKADIKRLNFLKNATSDSVELARGIIMRSLAHGRPA